MTDQTTKFPFYVCDTHALIWYLIQDAKLSPVARQTIKQAVQGDAVLTIPVIV